MATDYDAPRKNDDEPEADSIEENEAPGPKTPALPPRRHRRRPVPTWDEIVFGARPE